jgi:hypothetical protein
MSEDQNNNIVELDSYRPTQKTEPIGNKIIRITSELDGLEAIYSSDLSADHLFSIKILFWALLDNGQVCAVIPWLKDIVTTHDMHSDQGRWQGYYYATQDRIMFKPPEHKIKELQMGHQFYQEQEKLSLVENSVRVIHRQELPDHLGTHAAFKECDQKGFNLKPVISWKLANDGQLCAMIPKENNPPITPLPGSKELIAANDVPGFRYYFQHGIASKLKHQDPDAVTAVSLLIDLV